MISINPVTNLVIHPLSLTLDLCPMHMAPGGSTLVMLSGKAHDVAGFVRCAKEEIALGLCGVELGENKTVRLDVYMGNADVDEFLAMLEKTPSANCTFEKYLLEEGASYKAYTFTARERLLNALSEY